MKTQKDCRNDLRSEFDANRALWPRDTRGRFLPAGVPQGLQPWLAFNARRVR